MSKDIKFGSSIYTTEPEVVMFVNGIKCRVKVTVEFEDSGMPIDAKVEVTPCLDPQEPLTESIPNTREGEYKFGGYPDFIQGTWEPVAEDGTPYTYICTIYNGWGDMGNGNIFALIRMNQQAGDQDETILLSKPTIENVWVEASCC